MLMWDCNIPPNDQAVYMGEERDLLQCRECTMQTSGSPSVELWQVASGERFHFIRNAVCH
jgi:hypothetical protein